MDKMRSKNQTAGQLACFEYGDAPYDIHLEIRQVGADLLAAVTGGSRPHIGAVCLAEPAGAKHPVTGEATGGTKGDCSSVPASAGTDEQSPFVSVLSGQGHKDAVLAEMFASALCKKHGVNVCCTAGVHVDGATPDEIALMTENAKALLMEALDAYV
ncbi:MAG: hypothetical protein LBS91_00395 [Clostridiales Family XIII bacterium]|jgi:hypothetical protein|nr:hypothetical protein [Clostridiales Family XIII bacterium]